MSITLEGTSVRYTIGTPSTYTIDETNIDQKASAAYVPTVKRNKTGSAATRYIVFSVGYNTDSYNIACYKAVFTASGKTATVTAQDSLITPYRMGDLANENYNRLYVGISSSTALSYFDSGYVACTKKINLYPTITLTPTYTQPSPNMSTFGRIVNICQASVTAAIKKTWSYTGGSVTVPLTSSSLSGGGKTATGTTQTSLTLSLGAMTQTSITVTAASKNEQGLTATATVTLTCDNFTPPDITSETAIRSSGQETNAVLTVNYSLHAVNQRGTTGAITVAYTIKEGSTTVKSGSATICASGSVLANLTGTITINVTGNALDVDKNYSLQMQITDRVTTGAVKTDIITSTFRLLHINANGKGIGIGGAAPARGLQVYDDIKADSFNGVAAVYGKVTGGAGASSIEFTDANCIGKSSIVCTSMDVECGIICAKFPNKQAGTTKSSDGKIQAYFDRTLINNTKINYICW